MDKKTEAKIADAISALEIEQVRLNASIEVLKALLPSSDETKNVSSVVKTQRKPYTRRVGLGTRLSQSEVIQYREQILAVLASGAIQSVPAISDFVFNGKRYKFQDPIMKRLYAQLTALVKEGKINRVSIGRYQLARPESSSMMGDLPGTTETQQTSEDSERVSEPESPLTKATVFGTNYMGGSR